MAVLSDSVYYQIVVYVLDFYLWQSDMPSAKKRNVIGDCINETIEIAHESEAIETKRDEDIKDVTGSPDIVITLLSKIGGCDLFDADVSLCYTNNGGKEDKRGKKSPNPNVMTELGYDVRLLGWNRIICLCNTDYVIAFPFDIEHNRRTEYSFKEKDYNSEKNRIVKTILKNIRALKENNPRLRNGMTSRILRDCDFEKKRVTNVLVPIEIEKQKNYKLRNEEIIENRSD